jgi:hypothetical protein
MIPMLDHLIQVAGAAGVQETVIGMAHRGRLNVLVNTFGKMPADLFSEFEGINAAGGMDDKFRAALNAAQGSAQAQFGRSAAGIQKQLLSDAGMRGSPLQYALKAQAASDAANLGGDMSMRGAGMASDLRMQALNSMEGMSGRMRDQDFRAASQRAAAQDELNKWNREMSMRSVDQQSRAIEANNAGKRWAATGRATSVISQARRWRCAERTWARAASSAAVPSRRCRAASSSKCSACAASARSPRASRDGSSAMVAASCSRLRSSGRGYRRRNGRRGWRASWHEGTARCFRRG